MNDVGVGGRDISTDAVVARDLTRDFVVRRKAGRLRRTRVDVRAVDGITVTVARGAAVGYIGANGAGKSTTIKMLTGILTPSAGEVRTCGLQPVRQRRELARRIGVVFGQRSQLWWDLPLDDSLRILAAIHRLPDARFRARREELVDRIDLSAFLATPVRQLSLGQRMRGEIAAALLHEPELLVLDEPTVGLDVLSKERLRSVLREERELHGRTLLLTTHDMGDVERLCDRLLVVDRGRLVYDGDLAGLVARVGVRRVVAVDLTEPVAALHDVPGTEVVGWEEGGVRQRLRLAPGTTAAAVISDVAARAPLRDVTIEEPDIEEVVRQLYRSQV
jgi:ABC-2 type transport system ATP-binding protein